MGLLSSRLGACKDKMTNRQVEGFFKDNFGKEYHPLLHGRCETISPLTLVVKQKKKWYNRGKNLVAVANLSKYVEDGELLAHRRLAEDRMRKIEKKLAKDEVDRLEICANSQEYNIEVDEFMKAKFVTRDLPGDMVLGPLDEEYFEDPDLREILKTNLNTEKMSPFEDVQKIYIVTSVVYSDKLKIKGKPEHSDKADLRLSAGKFSKFLNTVEIPADVKVNRARKRYATPRIERKGRGPILFAYDRVVYKKSEGRLHLIDIVGKSINARGARERKKETYETVVDETQHHVEALHSITDLETKLEDVQKFLSTVEADKRKQLLETYLEHFEDVLDKDIIFSLLVGNPTEEQVALLQKFGFKVDGLFLKVKAQNVCLDYGKIFNYLNGLSEERLQEFQECGDTRDSVDGKRRKSRYLLRSSARK